MRRQFWAMRMCSLILWGKHKGKSVKYIIENDPEYIIWMCKNVKISLRFSKEVYNYYLENKEVDLFEIRKNYNLPFRIQFISNDR